MSNKRIKVSDDGGSNYYTLPGNQGEFHEENNMVNDTVFGQNYESMQPSLGQWNVTSNGIFKGVAGYNAILKKGGTPTTMTGEAVTLVATRIYQITNTAKRVISYLDAFTVLDGVTDVTAQVLTIDYLIGKITFKNTYTVVGTITVTGKYVPLSVIAKAKSWSLTQSCAPTDGSCYDDAQANSGHRTFSAGLNTVGLQIGAIYYATTAWLTTLKSRGIVYVEIDTDATGAGATVFRGFFKIASQGRSGNQGALEEETIQLNLWVPDGSLVVQPFGWYFNASTLSTAIQKVLTAWAAGTTLKVQYLPTGAIGASPNDGVQGDVVVAEASLANTAEGLNIFSFNFRGTGDSTIV